MNARGLGEALRLCRAREGSGRAALVAAATRLCVLPMTAYSVGIGGAMAAVEGEFSPPLFLAIMAGFLAAHALDNLLNDLTDYLRGWDRPGYLRVAYGPHPILSGVISVRGVKLFAVAVLGYNALLAAYLGVVVSPLIPLLALAGVAIMLGYSGYGVDLKRLGLGELGVVLVWGPVMAGGTYLALTGGHRPEALLAYTPYALTVGLVLLGKHLDKMGADSRLGVATLPVRLGERRARVLGAVVAVAAPIAAAFGVWAFTDSPAAAVALLALPASLLTAKALLRPKPESPPEGWRVWPLWHAAWTFFSVDSTGRYTLLALLAGGLGGVAGHAAFILAIGMFVLDLRSLSRTSGLLA